MSVAPIFGWGFLGLLSLALFCAAISKLRERATDQHQVLFPAAAITCAVAGLVSGLVYAIMHIPKQETCWGTVGDKVVWVQRSDSSRYAYVSIGANTYCKIYEPRLYYMGVGFVLDQPYEGYPETRP